MLLPPSCCFIGICQGDPNFNLNLHYQVYQGTCTCTVHTVKIVKSTLANGWFPIFIVCKFFPLVYSEFVMKWICFYKHINNYSMAVSNFFNSSQNLEWHIYRYLRSLTLVESELLTLSALHVLFCIYKHVSYWLKIHFNSWKSITKEVEQIQQKTKLMHC